MAAHWKRERAMRLHRICTCIERRLARGQTLDRATAYFVRTWARRHFKSAPERPIPASRGSLTRFLYAWRKLGRRPEAFSLLYKLGRPPVSPELSIRLLWICQASPVLDLRQAGCLLASEIAITGQGKLPASKASLYRHATARFPRLQELFAGRRLVRGLEARLQETLNRAKS